MFVDLDKSYGFDSTSIKNLLEDFLLFDEAISRGKITLKLPNKTSRLSELATVLIWMKMRSVNDNTNCVKQYIVDQKSKSYFDEQHFFDRLTISEKGSFFRKSKRIPFHFETFNLSEDEDATAKKISSAINESISDKPLASEIRSHISELVNNAFHHSQGSEVGCTSKMNENNGLFTFCISDTGKGVRDSFARNTLLAQQFKKFTDSQLLCEATKEDVTCNPSNAPQYTHRNSGIGLYYLTQFCRFHYGKLIIISDKGYYYTDGRMERLKNFRTPSRGTSVYFTAKVSDPMSDQYRQLVERYLFDFEEQDQFSLI